MSGPLVYRNDPRAGERDYLDGKPVHCGDRLQLQVFDVDYNTGPEEVSVERWVDVRYEIQWRKSGRTPVVHLIEGSRSGVYSGTDRFFTDLHDNDILRWPVEVTS